MAAAARAIVPPPPGFEIEDQAPVAAAPAVPAPPAGFEIEAAPAPAKPPVAVDPNDPRFSSGANTAGAMLRGVPVLGAGVEKAGAAISALAHPVTGVGSDKSSIAERYVDNLEQEEAVKSQIEKNSPIKNAVAGTIGGTLALGGAGAASPAVAKAMGMTGSLIPAATRAAVSGAGIGSLDAALRGEDPVSAGEVGALTGAGGVVAGKAAGKVWDAVSRTFRTPKAPVPGHTIDVNGEQVPVRESAITGDVGTSQEEQAVLHGARGEQAQRMAQEHAAASDEALARAQAKVAADLDPSGAAPTTSPQAAGETVAAELASAEQQRAAAEAQRLTTATTERAAIKKKLQLPGSQEEAPDVTPLAAEDVTPASAAEEVALGLRREATKAANARDAAYEALRTTEGEYDPAAFQNTATKIKEGLNAGTDPVKVDSIKTPMAAEALDDIEKNVGMLRFENRAEPRPLETAVAGNQTAQHAQDLADIRKRFGDEVAHAYDRQKAPATAAPQTGPKTQSLLEFIASKGGLGPDAELEAIGGHGHTVNVEGMGRRKLVRQGGWPLDYAREAAEEAGYLRGDHKGTSTVNDLLDAIDAEIRGKKRYPEGFEGHTTSRESAAMSDRERHEYDAHIRAIEKDLEDAGHGQLGPDVKARAVHLMANEGMDADTAVENAFHRLELEDATAHHGSDFPGDRPAAVAGHRPITLDTIDTARKRLIAMQRQANEASRRTGDRTDVRAMRRIISEFDDHVAKATRAPGNFSGNAEEALGTLNNARKLHSELKQTFGPKNPQDDVGKAIEKIIGRNGATPAEIETVAPMLYGNPTEPGGALQTRVAQRIKEIFGEHSKEWAAHRQGLFSHLTETPHGIEAMSNEKVADRLHRFFSGTKGVGLSQTLFSPSERAKLLTHANKLRMAADPHPQGQVEKLIAKWAGRDGGEQASAKTVIDGLMGASGKKGMAPQIVKALRTHLSPKGFAQLKQGVFSRITEPPEGMIDWGHQKQGQRIMDFLHGDGKGLADALFSKTELAKIESVGRAHIKMVPPPGSTNPSGSGHVAARLARSAAHSILPFVGLHAGGLPGVGAAVAIDKTASRILDKRAAARAVKLFYGPQKSAPASRFPQSFGALAGAVSAGQSR
jgi:hypothetical protein